MSRCAGVHAAAQPPQASGKRPDRPRQCGAGATPRAGQRGRRWPPRRKPPLRVGLGHPHQFRVGVTPRAGQRGRRWRPRRRRLRRRWLSAACSTRRLSAARYATRGATSCAGRAAGAPATTAPACWTTWRRCARGLYLPDPVQVRSSHGPVRLAVHSARELRVWKGRCGFGPWKIMLFRCVCCDECVSCLH